MYNSLDIYISLMANVAFALAVYFFCCTYSIKWARAGFSRSGGRLEEGKHTH